MLFCDQFKFEIDFSKSGIVSNFLFWIKKKKELKEGRKEGRKKKKEQFNLPMRASAS